MLEQRKVDVKSHLKPEKADVEERLSQPDNIRLANFSYFKTHLILFRTQGNSANVGNKKVQKEMSQPLWTYGIPLYVQNVATHNIM